MSGTESRGTSVSGINVNYSSGYGVTYVTPTVNGWNVSSPENLAKALTQPVQQRIGSGSVSGNIDMTYFAGDWIKLE